MKPNLLIVDDEEGVRESFRMALQDDYRLTFAEDAKAALRELKKGSFDLCLLDIMLPDGSGLDLLDQVKRRDEGIEVIMVTALQGVETALTAMRGKACDYITKPFRVDDLLTLIPTVLARRRAAGIASPGLVQIEWKGGESTRGKAGVGIEEAAKTGKPVWLTGENGTGILEAAREIHRSGPRSKGPFVPMGCGSLGEGSLERELFGVEIKGRAPQIGKLEFAHGGAILLMDADKMPIGIQSRLGKCISPTALGRPDVQLLASSSQDLRLLVEKGSIQKDFFSLFEAQQIRLTPLRERSSEIAGMVRRFLEGTRPKAHQVQKEAMEFLVKYPWPGNLKELEDCLGTMVHFAVEGTLTLEDIPLDLLIKQAELSPSSGKTKHVLKKVTRQFERKYIRRVLEETRGNQTQAAATLGLHRNTLILKLKELNLEDEYQKIVHNRRELGLGFRDR